jgi:hypothetical protein
MWGSAWSQKPKDRDIGKHCCDNLKFDDRRVVCNQREEECVRKREDRKEELKEEKTLKNGMKKEKQRRWEERTESIGK